MVSAVAILTIALAGRASAQAVHFDDPKLKAAVEAALGKTNPTATDMLGLTYLYAYDRGITDLTGLEYATNLTGLDLGDNQVSDISPLAGLTNLHGLNLTSNPLNEEACSVYIPQIKANNPGISISYDPCTNVIVPNVVGMTQSDAEAALTAAGFKVGTIFWTASDTPWKTVIGRAPAAGQMAPVGSEVDLTCSQWDVQPTVPKAVAHWRLDESTGRVAQDAAGTHNGTLVGNPAWPPSSGKIRGALQFDGAGDYVETPHRADLDLTTKITLGAWIRVGTFDKAWQAIVTKSDSAWRLHRLPQRDSLAFHCSMNNGEVSMADGATNVNDGQWRHVAGTYDGTKVCLYIDGRLDASVSASGPIATNTYPVMIGENAQSRGREWKGLMDEVQIYDGALDAQQVLALVSGGPVIQGKQYYADAAAHGQNNGLTWAGAFQCLQDALAVGKAGDAIWMAQGIYTPDRGNGLTRGNRRASFRPANGVSILGGFPPGGGTLQQRDPSRYLTTLSGDLTANDATVTDPCELLTEPTRADNSLHVVMAVNCDQ